MVLPVDTAAPLEVQIWVETHQPPTGRIQAGAADPQPFVGWLQLLKFLTETLGTGDHGAPPPGPVRPAS